MQLIPMRNLAIFTIFPFFISFIVAQSVNESKDYDCNGIHKTFIKPGEETKIEIPFGSECRSATAVFNNTDPLPIPIDSNCAHHNSSSQIFSLQFDKNMSIGDTNIMFLCGMAEETYCLGFNFEEPRNQQGHDRNVIKRICPPNPDAPPTNSGISTFFSVLPTPASALQPSIPTIPTSEFLPNTAINSFTINVSTNPHASIIPYTLIESGTKTADFDSATTTVFPSNPSSTILFHSKMNSSCTCN